MSNRRILHHGPAPTGTAVLLSDRAIGGCWFELYRQGGCGAGELVLQREFAERRSIEIGDWISCEWTTGQRWYLGRVEECHYQSKGLMKLRLAGMSIELNEVFPGGFNAMPADRQPQRYGATDLFSNDPDRNWEAAHSVSTIDAFVRLLMQQYVVNQTHITYLPALVEAPSRPVEAQSAKFRGEESLRSVLKDLALRAQASWGVDAFGRFYFRCRRNSVQSTFQLGRDLVTFEESRDREMIFNRLLLTGDYIYDHRDNSGQIARRVYRWRASYFEPRSCEAFGNRRLKLWVPWIRTQVDSVAFAREFFRLYAQPAPRYSVETVPCDTLVIPWEGPVTLLDASGAVLSSGLVEKVRVLFDHAPRLRLEVGPEDPREQWPEPPQDERWELPDHVPSNGGNVSVTDFGLPSNGDGGGGGGGGGGNSSGSRSSSQLSSERSSDFSSDESSSMVFGGSSSNSQDGTQWLTSGGTSLSDLTSLVRTSDTNSQSSSVLRTSTRRSTSEENVSSNGNYDTGETSSAVGPFSSPTSNTGFHSPFTSSSLDSHSCDEVTNSHLRTESSESELTTLGPPSSTEGNHSSCVAPTSGATIASSHRGELTSSHDMSSGPMTSSGGVPSSSLSASLSHPAGTSSLISNHHSHISHGGLSSEHSLGIPHTSSGPSPSSWPHTQGTHTLGSTSVPPTSTGVNTFWVHPSSQWNGSHWGSSTQSQGSAGTSYS